MSETSDDTQRRCRFWVSHCKKNIFLLAIISFISGNIFFLSLFQSHYFTYCRGGLTGDAQGSRHLGTLSPLPLFLIVGERPQPPDRSPAAPPLT